MWQQLLFTKRSFFNFPHQTKLNRFDNLSWELHPFPPGPCYHDFEVREESAFPGLSALFPYNAQDSIYKWTPIISAAITAPVPVYQRVCTTNKTPGKNSRVGLSLGAGQSPWCIFITQLQTEDDLIHGVCEVEWILILILNMHFYICFRGKRMCMELDRVQYILLLVRWKGS